MASDNAATPGEGWFIDDLRVDENPNRNNPITLPFTEDFESSATGWLLSGWRAAADEGAVDDGHVLRTGSPGLRMAPDTLHWAVLDRPVQLAQGSKDQATFWTRGQLNTNSHFRLNYSTNGGVTWSDFGSVNQNPGFNTTTWTRG